MNRIMAGFGERPTASPSHQSFIDWVEAQAGSIPGAQISHLDETIDRWLQTSASLEVDERPLRVAGAVPYAKPADVTAPVVYVPPGTALAGANVAGKVVVRDVVPGAIQLPVFLAVAYYVHDPALSFDWSSSYERDWISAGAIVTDLQQAAAAGAAGVVFVHQLPYEQVRGHYAPYTGDHWSVPAVYVGTDEGAATKAAGTARVVVQAERADAPTRTVIATLPGKSPERISIASHTDGMNAVWDNGPIAILALARYFASLPLECRPRTLEFAFTSAHLHLAKAGAERYAAMLDEAYDEGTVALAIALEHLGAREYVAAPREAGGRELKATGNSELFAIFSTESPALASSVIGNVVARDLRRSFVLRGADAPQAGIPPHRSYGGEGGPYHGHLVPTVAAITGPTTLFKPDFAMDDILDVELMRRQAMAFGDLVLDVDDMPREVIAGADTAYRAVRGL